MVTVISFLVGMIFGAVLLMLFAVAVSSKNKDKKEDEYRRETENDRQD